MRVVVCAVCVMVGTARADDAKAVEAAIHAAIEQPWQTSAGAPGWYEHLAGVKIAAPSGGVIATKDELARELADCGIAQVTWKLGAVTLGADAKRGFAWFQAPVVADVDCGWPGFAAPMVHDTLRASGILVLDQARWRLVALGLSRQLPDAKLFKLADDTPASGDPALDDSAAAKGASAWFGKRGLARSNSTGDVVASGTAPTEYAAGAGAARLATAWDKLALRPTSIEATPFAGGAIAWVRAVVPLPVKHKTAPMTLFAIAIADGKDWRWASLQFTSSLAKPPEPTTPDTTGIECPHGKC